MHPTKLALIAITTTLLAQSPRPAFDKFEVATIKPATDEPARYIRMQSVNRFYAKGFTLQALIAAAYSLNPRAISGGAPWTDSDRYDILASTPHEIQPNLDEQMAMLRDLLADRFKLTFHREPKEFPIYAITIAKNSPKLKPSAAPPEKLPELVNVVYPDAGGGLYVKLPARNATIAQFAAMLQRAVMDRPVVDKTGLAGAFDFDLEYTPDETQFAGTLARAAEATKPNLFTAMQEQLGLRVEPTRGPIAALVIDRVERPSEN